MLFVTKGRNIIAICLLTVRELYVIEFDQSARTRHIAHAYCMSRKRRARKCQGREENACKGQLAARIRCVAHRASHDSKARLKTPSCSLHHIVFL